MPVPYSRCFPIILAAFFLCTSAWARPFEDTLAQRTLACTACHGDQGRAGPDGYYPRLAGKPVGYLYNQLINFREGRRHYALMTGLLEPLSDAYLMDIAKHFSSLQLPYPAPRPTDLSPSLQARGRALATVGDSTLRIPACIQCHGAALTGVSPNVPGLLGLPRDYLNAQLGGWQTGQRRTRAPDCMAHIAKKLSAEDTHAVAAWLSSQPVPTNAAAVAQRPPLAPGGVDIACASATPPSAASTARSTEQVERGAYLARIGNCALCHTARGGEPYAGGRGIDTPFGTVYSSNLTPDITHGIGRWTEPDFWNALHHGKSKDGRLLNPAFPYTSYTHVSREDSDAIRAFLLTVKPSGQANAAHALRWPFGTQPALMAWRSLYFTPASESRLPRGEYLARGLGHCFECHAGRNALGAIATDGMRQGGVLSGSLWYAPSLTTVPEGAVAPWSVEQTTALLLTGRTPAASALGPMAEVVLHGTQYLSDGDATAIAQYLQGIGSPAVPAGTSPLPPSVTRSTLSRGATIYERHCAECHGKAGQGQPGAYPALAGNRRINLPTTNNLILTVLHGGFGPATQGNPAPYGMPPFMLTLNDAEVAAVLTYLRSSWGNSGAPVTEFDINKLRSSLPP